LACIAVLVHGQVFISAVAVDRLLTLEDKFHFARVKKHLHLWWSIVVKPLEGKA
jgi:hypothetical protein